MPVSPSREDAQYLPYLRRRLTDDAPLAKTERYSPSISIEQVKADIFENIRMLFSSRAHRRPNEVANDPEIQTSVLCYGLVDYCGKICSKDDREALRRTILEQVTNFEPRLKPESVRVTFSDKAEATVVSRIELSIAGTVEVNGAAVDVLFASHLDMESGYVDVVAQ